MTLIRNLMMLTLGLSISACAAVDVPSRNAPFEPQPSGQLQVPPGYQAQQPTGPLLQPSDVIPVVAVDALGSATPVRVTSVLVRVPRNLQVSEANRYLPRGDIVWREDPLGDRHVQVQTIVQAAMERGVAGLNGRVPVVLDIKITRFHALTEKARYTTGGVHAISFEMAVKHPETGALLMPVRKVRADFKAFGGQQALVAMASGQTQKVRITNHLAAVIQQELTNAEGYKDANVDFSQMLNNM